MSYLTRPLDQKGMPAGIPYIIGNEAAERFSFYGMRTILVVFMTQYLMGASGVLAPMGEEDAKGWYHLFVSAVYFTPLLALFWQTCGGESTRLYCCCHWFTAGSSCPGAG